MDDINRRADGRDDFVAAWEAGWHNKGTVAQRDLTVADALDILDPGQVTKVPIYGDVVGPDGLPVSVPIPGSVATFRIRSGGAEVTPLGIVSEGYPVFDERESFGFLEHIVGSGKAMVSAMYLMAGGRRAAACLELGEELLVGGFDPVKRYLFCATSHDGSYKYRAGATNIRTVCKNTTDLAVGSCARMYELKHVPGAQLNVEKAREVIGVVEAYEGAFAAYSEQMIATKVTNDTFDKMVRELHGKAADRPGASKKAITTFKRTLDLSMDLWNGATIAGAGIGNTAWGAWNVFTEMEQWFGSVRPEKGQPKIDQTGAEAMTKRWEAAIMGDNEDFANKAQRLVMAMA